MNSFVIRGVFVCICLSVLIFTPKAYSFQQIKVATLLSPPVLDGLKNDWGEQKLSEIPLKKNRADGTSNVSSVSIMAGVYKDNFFIYAQWIDDTENKIHKPFIWNESEERYTRGPQREDRFSIQFGMEGEYTTQWFSGKEFKADMWHWKSSRTNPVNLAHDKMTVISSNPIKKSYKATTKEGKIIYLYRPSDSGEPIYYSKRYSIKEKEMMPKYLFKQNPSGSITDVKAKGIWKNGLWMLELKRKLDTGNNDDVIFTKGNQVKSGIGIFNASEANDHNISEVIIFQF